MTPWVIACLQARLAKASNALLTRFYLDAHAEEVPASRASFPPDGGLLPSVLFATDDAPPEGQLQRVQLAVSAVCALVGELELLRLPEHQRPVEHLLVPGVLALALVAR
jgi:hypothetical protein